jgi:hypothetical protein
MLECSKKQRDLEGASLIELFQVDARTIKLEKRE